MSIENQIAIHCDEDEKYCPECKGTMTYDKDGDLQCDDIECDHIIILTGSDY